MVGLNCPRNAARKFRRNVWGANQRQPFRSHILCVYQSEMVGPIRNPPNTVLLLTLLTNHKPPFLKKRAPIWIGGSSVLETPFLPFHPSCSIT